MKRLLIILGFFASPLAAQDVSLPHALYKLDNGLTLIVHEDDSVPIAAVDVWYHVGSGYEAPGRTGFAHLFEHVMFEGSANVPRGEFDQLMESAGGLVNGSTTTDRTNYYEVVPSNAVELALWLEADRMGGLLETMGQEKLDIQREVVKNERRQRYENAPYGLFYETAAAALYPEDHPYSWTPIGSMDDLTAASLEDVESFFQRYYAPNNAVLVVAGNVEADQIRDQVERLFGWIPRGPEVDRPSSAVPPIEETRFIVLEDQVTLPQVNLAWRTQPLYGPDDAALDVLAQIIGAGRNSRLHRRLIFDEQIAQDVSAYNSSSLLSGDLYLRLTARPDVNLSRLQEAALEEIEKLAEAGPAQEELERVVNSIQTSFVRSLETALGRADQLNLYYYYAGDPDFASEDLARYRTLTPADIQRAARRYLVDQERVVISIVPEGRTDLAASAGEGR